MEQLGDNMTETLTVLEFHFLVGANRATFSGFRLGK